MPELPEVETIVRGLRRSVVGKTIAGADVRLARMVVAPAGVEFARAISGAQIVATRRRGKYAVIELDSGRSLVVSLRMTGRLVATSREAPEYPRSHVVLTAPGSISPM
jgi:formamidopyrimidine-DNA glycosylase